MSRSFKKHPYANDGDSNLRWRKRQSSKKVRRTADIPNGNEYKKVYETWNIRDYNYYYPISAAIAAWEREEAECALSGYEGHRHRKYKTFKNYLVHWKLSYLRK